MRLFFLGAADLFLLAEESSLRLVFRAALDSLTDSSSFMYSLNAFGLLYIDLKSCLVSSSAIFSRNLPPPLGPQPDE